MIAILEDLDVATEPTLPKPRSGGPRTPEGKERSRRNALKHGLRATVLLPDDLADAVARCTAEFSEEFRPASPYEDWLVDEMARAAARLDRCAAMALADLRRVVERAELCWETDRRQGIEDLGARLAKDPARVAHALRRSRQGADWLIERWEGLGEVLTSRGAWDESQRRLAFDLLGVPAELRDGSTRLPPSTDAAGLAVLVARQVDRLREDRAAVLDELDASERSMTMAGMPLDEDATTRRIRLYESSCRRALHRAQDELRRGRSASSEAGAGPRPDAPPPAARPEPSRAAMVYLVNRAQSAPEVLLDLDPPADPPTPAPARPTRPLNRRARRALERRAVQEARREVRAPEPSGATC